jgi:hypothetical protein
MKAAGTKAGRSRIEDKQQGVFAKDSTIVLTIQAVRERRYSSAIWKSPGRSEHPQTTNSCGH